MDFKIKTNLIEKLKKGFGLTKVGIHFNFLFKYSLPSREFKYFSWTFINIVKKLKIGLKYVQKVHTTKSMWSIRLDIS